MQCNKSIILYVQYMVFNSYIKTNTIRDIKPENIKQKNNPND